MLSESPLPLVLETALPLSALSRRPIGAHMPTAGGLQTSLIGGKAIGCTAVQLFTSSPKQWASPALKPEVVEAFLAAKEQTGIETTVAHDSYLINLAAPSEEVLEKSRKAFRGELDRAEQIGLSWVVTHMGAHLGQGVESAISRLIQSLTQILAETDSLGYRVGIALETTAGQGTGLGANFEELASVLNGVGPHPRLGVCLDTCHIFVAGYDFRTPETYAETWAKFDAVIGLPRLKIVHVNDAKKPLGSRVDRHEHLGEGEIGEEAFRLLINDPRLFEVPFIVETPDSDEMHRVNVERLRGYLEA